MAVRTLDTGEQGRILSDLARFTSLVLLVVRQVRMAAQHRRVDAQRNSTRLQVAINVIIARYRPGLPPEALGQLPHPRR